MGEEAIVEKENGGVIYEDYVVNGEGVEEENNAHESDNEEENGNENSNVEENDNYNNNVLDENQNSHVPE
ncbi:hypothetical protein THOM_1411 [Trachipleistophora hominis]|uniref:Uncharacterized protein n=1 Tax=Trachipleistophora hominis TaxID=72359 RepID=L7JWE8_TRAHO|nr:hypothetical protein THOM_1411 [Trachipleistophora hominis]